MSGMHSSTTPFGVVYFVRVGDDGPIKIGFTARPIADRLREIESCCPGRLCVVLTISGVGVETERRLHARFGRHRLHGEWFSPDPELLGFIEHAASNPLSLLIGGPVRPTADAERSLGDPAVRGTMRRRDRNILRDLACGLSVTEIARRRRLHRRTIHRVYRIARTIAGIA